MDDLPDLQLREESPEPPEAPVPRRSVSGTSIAVVAVMLAAAGAAVYFFLRPEPLTPARRAPVVAGAPASSPATPSLGGTPEAVTVPPLDGSDEVVRSLVRAMSTASAITRWLTTRDLIRTFTAAVASVASGGTPTRALAVLRPSMPFQVVQRDGRSYVDPRSYARYDGIAEAVLSVDPAAAARLYATLKPRIGDAYHELGLPDPSFDTVLERAIVELLKTPVVDQPIAVEPKGIGYAYADDRLERLSNAQKQLLRMGPQNTRVIQGRLRGIALALGIPPDQLPGH